ncbi:MAG: membrane integrity-associated transporter subunit PqiC [Nitrospirae bacterium]|nr:membrane integrity-associated transporter subunit PqiC [Nitrospirota bacterium]
MSNMLRRGIFLLGVLVMAACAMPETRIYSLHMPADNLKTQARKQAMITVRVQSPRYLAQPYIAHRLSPYQLEISRYAKWDSAPVEMVREIFKDSLSVVYQDVRASNFAAEGSFVLNINLKRFERVEDSYAELAFDAVLNSAEGRELYRIAVAKKVQIETRDSAGLAKGLSAALSESVKEVVAGLGVKI